MPRTFIKFGEDGNIEQSYEVPDHLPDPSQVQEGQWEEITDFPNRREVIVAVQVDSYIIHSAPPLRVNLPVSLPSQADRRRRLYDSHVFFPVPLASNCQIHNFPGES